MSLKQHTNVDHAIRHSNVPNHWQITSSKHIEGNEWISPRNLSFHFSVIYVKLSGKPTWNFGRISEDIAEKIIRVWSVDQR